MQKDATYSKAKGPLSFSGKSTTALAFTIKGAKSNLDAD